MPTMPTPPPPPAHLQQHWQLHTLQSPRSRGNTGRTASMSANLVGVLGDWSPVGQTPKLGYRRGAGHNPTLLPPTAAHNIARLLNMLGFQASHKLLPLAERRSPLSPLNVGSSLSLEARPITLHSTGLCTSSITSFIPSD